MGFFSLFRRGEALAGEGQRAPLLSHSTSYKPNRTRQALELDAARRTAQASLKRAARAAASTLEETADTVAGNWQSLGAALARSAQSTASQVQQAAASAASSNPSEASFAWPTSSTMTLMVSRGANGADAERLLADLPAPLAAAARALRRDWNASSAASAASAAASDNKASEGNKRQQQQQRSWPFSPRSPPPSTAAAANEGSSLLLPAGDGPLQREAAKRRKATSSSLRDPGRRIAIFTTASLPWMTGTAVNPLLRAAYLAADASSPSGAHREVTLFVPWLPRRDQDAVFPPGGARFDTPAQQEAWVRKWAKERTGLKCDFQLGFYAARYAAEKGSILPVGDITECVDKLDGRIPAKKKKKKKEKKESASSLSTTTTTAALSAQEAEGEGQRRRGTIADVAVLEEPEHLTWYHHGARWADKFEHVVGVVHTNYLDYAAREEGGALKAAALKFLNGAVVRAHTHKVVKLSDAVQALPRSVTEFVHGVPQAFLEVGRSKGRAVRRAHKRSSSKAARGGLPDGSGGDDGDESLSDGGDLIGSDPVPQISFPWQQPHKNSPSPPPPASDAFGHGAYFIGKALWAKGYTELLDLLEEDAKEGERLEKLRRSLPPLLLANRGVASLFGISPGTNDDDDDNDEEGDAPAAAAAVPPRRRRRLLPNLGGNGSDKKTKKKSSLAVVDCFGTGPDLDDLRSSASSRKLPVRFHGAADHLAPRLHDYRVLVNPSTSDVVATTTAEALAMGKWVLVADLPCNAFFKTKFRNCLTYKTPKEFSKGLRKALTHDPHPVSSDEAAALSWEAATQRFLDACSLAPGERATSTSLSAAADRAIYSAHNALMAIEPVREAAGAGRGTRDAPESLEGWQPEVALGSRGLFDRKN